MLARQLARTSGKSCMAKREINETLVADGLLAATAGINVTPSFIVDGLLYRGGQPNIGRAIEALFAEDQAR